MILDGLVIHGNARSGANAFPNEHLFVVPTTNSVTGTPVEAGDLCVLFDLANNNTAAIPALVTPTGFTSIGGTTGADGSGNGARCAASYKILAAADIGATFTGMNGTENERKMVCSFRMSRPVQSVTPGGFVVSAPTGGDPSGVSIVVPGSSTGNILVLAMACAENPITALTSWTPGGGSQYVSPANAADELGAATATRSPYTYYPYGVTPSNHILDVGDFSTFDTTTLCGFYLILG